MNIADAMDIAYPMKYIPQEPKPIAEKKYFCTHWQSNQSCFYSEMHRCKEGSYGCEFNQN